MLHYKVLDGLCFALEVVNGGGGLEVCLRNRAAWLGVDTVICFYRIW